MQEHVRARHSVPGRGSTSVPWKSCEPSLFVKGLEVPCLPNAKMLNSCSGEQVSPPRYQLNTNPETLEMAFLGRSQREDRSLGDVVSALRNNKRVLAGPRVGFRVG